MSTQWSWSRSWSACSKTALGPPSVPKPSKKVVKKTLEIRLSRKLSRLRPKPPWIFLYESVRWMLAAPEATILPQNLPKIIPRTKTPFCSALKKHEPCLLIVSSELRLRRNRIGTIRRVGIKRIIAIAAPVASSLSGLPRPLGLTRPRPRLRMILAVTSRYVGKIRKWAKPFITTIIRRAILQTNALSPASQKTSIGLGDLVVGDWC